MTIHTFIFNNTVVLLPVEGFLLLTITLSNGGYSYRDSILSEIK
jgi:hypothetical protein